MSRKVPSQARNAAATGFIIVGALCTMAFAAGPDARPAKPKAKAQTTVPVPRNRPTVPVPQGKPTGRTRPSPASFTPEMTFTEAIEILRNCTTPPLNLVVLWKEIGENAGVYRETPIGIDGVPGHRVKQHLELLLLSLSAGASAKLGYAVRHGVITVATTDALPVSRRVTRVYDISDLVAPPARYFMPPPGFGVMGFGGGMMGGGMMGGGMMGGGMMGGRGGYGGGLGTGYVPGMSYMSGGSYGSSGGRLSGLVNGLYGGNGRRSGTYRR
jgi:hypothetical protein